MISKYDCDNMAREFPQMGLTGVEGYPVGHYRNGSKFGTGKTINVFTGKEVTDMPDSETADKQRNDKESSKGGNDQELTNNSNVDNNKCSNSQHSNKNKEEGKTDESKINRDQRGNSNNCNEDQRRVSRQEIKTADDGADDDFFDDVTLMFENHDDDDDNKELGYKED